MSWPINAKKIVSEAIEMQNGIYKWDVRFLHMSIYYWDCGLHVFIYSTPYDFIIHLGQNIKLPVILGDRDEQRYSQHKMIYMMP